MTGTSRPAAAPGGPAVGPRRGRSPVAPRNGRRSGGRSRPLSTPRAPRRRPLQRGRRERASYARRQLGRFERPGRVLRRGAGVGGPSGPARGRLRGGPRWPRNRSSKQALFSSKPPIMARGSAFRARPRTPKPFHRSKTRQDGASTCPKAACEAGLAYGKNAALRGGGGGGRVLKIDGALF